MDLTLLFWHTFTSFVGGLMAIKVAQKMRCFHYEESEDEDDIIEQLRTDNDMNKLAYIAEKLNVPLTDTDKKLLSEMSLGLLSAIPFSQIDQFLKSEMPAEFSALLATARKNLSQDPVHQVVEQCKHETYTS